MSDSCNPIDCSPPGSSVHGIFQSRILEWVAISFSRGSCLTQGWNPRLLHCRQILNSLSHLVLISFHWWVILEKTLMLGKIEGKRRRGQQRMRWLDSIIDSMDMNLSKLWDIVKDREGALQSIGSQRVRHNLVTEKQQHFLPNSNWNIVNRVSFSLECRHSIQGNGPAITLQGKRNVAKVIESKVKMERLSYVISMDPM